MDYYERKKKAFLKIDKLVSEGIENE